MFLTVLNIIFQLYHIPYDAIQAALELFTEEPSLEYRLWRVCAIRTATVILRNQSQYIVNKNNKNNKNNKVRFI